MAGRDETMKQSLTIQLEPAEVSALMKGRGVTLTDSAGRELTLLFAPDVERPARLATMRRHVNGHVENPARVGMPPPEIPVFPPARKGTHRTYTAAERARVRETWERVGATMSVREFAKRTRINAALLQTRFGVYAGGKVKA